MPKRKGLHTAESVNDIWLAQLQAQYFGTEDSDPEQPYGLDHWIDVDSKPHKNVLELISSALGMPVPASLITENLYDLERSGVLSIREGNMLGKPADDTVFTCPTQTLHLGSIHRRWGKPLVDYLSWHTAFEVKPCDLATVCSADIYHYDEYRTVEIYLDDTDQDLLCEIFVPLLSEADFVRYLFANTQMKVFDNGRTHVIDNTWRYHFELHLTCSAAGASNARYDIDWHIPATGNNSPEVDMIDVFNTLLTNVSILQNYRDYRAYACEALFNLPNAIDNYEQLFAELARIEHTWGSLELMKGNLEFFFGEINFYNLEQTFMQVDSLQELLSDT
jgi:hypothetical protein